MVATQSVPRRWFAGRLALLLLIPLAVTGCGPGTGKISGQVVFNGKPLPGGRLTFKPADTSQNPVQVDLDENGNYEATVPAGECKISVDNRAVEGGEQHTVGAAGGGRAGGPGGPPKAATVNPPNVQEQMREKGAPGGPGVVPKTGTYVQIPKKYYDAEASGLTVTVARGENKKQDIELKP